jgi:O-antigen/teichoic acid export membrane protein
MHSSKKFAFDVGITFLASVVTLPLGFVITIFFGRYLGAGDLGLYRMTSTIYGIAMLVAEVGFLRHDVLQTFLSIEIPK